MLLSTADESRHNPFRFGDVATGEHFTDRTAELTELVQTRTLTATTQRTPAHRSNDELVPSRRSSER